MNVLILDFKNDSLIKSLRDNKQLKVFEGTICKPKLFPIPDVILLDFDEVLGYNSRENNLIELAAKLHPQVTIIACSKKWNPGARMFAKRFGADILCYSNKPREIRSKILYYT